MRNTSPATALVVALLVANLGPTTQVRAASLLEPTISSVPPEDESEDQGFEGNPIDFFDAYSWRLFIALNWPAKAGVRGEPDTTKTIGDLAGPRVWETWKSASEAIPRDGSEPTDWSSLAGPDLCSGDPGGGAVKVMAFAMPGPVFEDFNQVSATGMAVGSLVARNRTYVRYEIRMNQKQYDHIRSKKLNLRETLNKMAVDDPARTFPDQSIEIKAAWRELRTPDDDAIANRYYKVEARAFNPEMKTCETKRFGLIGFHIAQKTKQRRQWTWSTFEHVDNLTAPPGLQSTLVPADANDASLPGGGITQANPPKAEPEPTKVHRFVLGPGTIPPSQTESTNEKWHSQPEIANSVWKNYILVLTQWPREKFQNTGLGNPFPTKNVANVTLETFQSLQASSCIGCHFPAAKNFGTDFAWFVGLRAFPVPPAVPPGGNVPGAKKSKAFIERLKKAATQAQQPTAKSPK